MTLTRRVFCALPLRLGGALAASSVLQPLAAWGKPTPVIDPSWTSEQIRFKSTTDPITDFAAWTPARQRSAEPILTLLRQGYERMKIARPLMDPAVTDLNDFTTIKREMAGALLQLPNIKRIVNHSEIESPSFEFLLYYAVPRALAPVGILTKCRRTEWRQPSSGKTIIDFPELMFYRIHQKETNQNTVHPWFGRFKAPVFWISPNEFVQPISINPLPPQGFSGLCQYGAIFVSRESIERDFKMLKNAFQVCRDDVMALMYQVGAGRLTSAVDARPQVIAAARAGKLTEAQIYKYAIVTLVERGLGGKPLQFDDHLNLVLSHEKTHGGELRDREIVAAFINRYHEQSSLRVQLDETIAFLGELRTARVQPLALANLIATLNSDVGTSHKAALRTVLTKLVADIADRANEFGMDVPQQRVPTHDILIQLGEVFDRPDLFNKLLDSMYCDLRNEILGIASLDSPPVVPSPTGSARTHPGPPELIDPSPTPSRQPEESIHWGALLGGGATVAGLTWVTVALYYRKQKIWLGENIRNLGISRPDVTWVTLIQLKVEDATPMSELQKIFTVANQNRDSEKAALARRWLTMFAGYTPNQAIRVAIQQFLKKTRT